MAPEQAVGDPSVDRRADIFSSGIVLWEVLAAKRLFKAENEAATLSRVISEPIPHICDVNPDIDRAVGDVVMKSLERDRDQRYFTCQEFADELERTARAANLIASTREVAGYVGEVIGQEISQQREAVRAWLARSEPSQAAPPEMADLHSSMPPALSGLPKGTTGEHSGMVASPIAAPLGAPMLETGGRPKPTLVIAGAAALGFVIVALLVLLLRKESPPPPLPAAVQPAAVQAPAAAPVTPAPVAPAVATAAPPANSEPMVIEEPANPTQKGARGGGHVARPVGGHAAPAAAPPAAAPAAPKPAKPAEPASGGDIDLSNPYR
jgi:serine/threonine-protein kinase